MILTEIAFSPNPCVRSGREGGRYDQRGCQEIGLPGSERGEQQRLAACGVVC